MLHFSNSRIKGSGVDPSGEAEATDFIDLDRLLGAIRRQIWAIVGCAAIGLLVGIAYLASAVPLYTAQTDILVYRADSKVLSELSGLDGGLKGDADMLSQVELIKSQQMAIAVVTALKLDENVDFMNGTPSVVGSAVEFMSSVFRDVVEWISPSISVDLDDSQIAAARMERAVGILLSNVSVTRVGTTFVISVVYTSSSPTLAGQIARKYGDAYLDDQLQAKFNSARRASEWLQIRIAELRQQSYDADLAVQRFRMENGLITAGGQLVSEQQLSEINTQLIMAQAATAESKARLDQINGLIASGRADAVVNDSLASSIISSLRTKYLDVSKRESEISNELGPDHMQVVRLRAEMLEYEKQIFQELRRIAESYASSYSVAQSREQSIRESLGKTVGINAAANTTQVKLRELERQSETFRLLYDNFLQRYQETIQQQSFPVTEARIIAQPNTPKRPSFPKKPLVLALFMVLGAASGVALAGFREYRDRFFRLGAQIREELDLEFLGYVPLIDASKSSSDHSLAQQDAAGGGLWRPASVGSYGRSHPMSAFAETMRNVKVAADIGLSSSKSKVIGIVSCLPGEGKSVISANLSTLLAMQGFKVLLIDGDIRNPGLTRELSVRPESGLVEVLLNIKKLSDVLKWDLSGMLAIMPTILSRRISHSSELLTSPTMSHILSEQRDDFDYILIDLPPIGPVVDAKALAHHIDAFVLVVEWGRTSRQVVRSMLALNSVVYDKTLGVLLNKTDEGKMKLYREYGSIDYTSSRYRDYYFN